MMVTGLPRVFSSSGTLLPLLLLATTATTLVQRAAAQASPTPAPAPAADCTAEYLVCIADDTCNDCITAPFSSTAFEECSESGFFTSATDCDNNMETACCLDDISEFDCMDNDAFSGYVTCFLDSVGCSTDFSCDGADVGSGAAASATLGGASTVAAFSCALMVVMLPLLLSV